MAKVLRKTRYQDWSEPSRDPHIGHVLGLFIPQRQGCNKGTDKMRFLLYPLICCFLLYGVGFGALLRISQERAINKAIAVHYLHYSIHDLGNIRI